MSNDYDIMHGNPLSPDSKAGLARQYEAGRAQSRSHVLSPVGARGLMMETMPTNYSSSRAVQMVQVVEVPPTGHAGTSADGVATGG